jgi:hypothetical protein
MTNDSAFHEFEVLCGSAQQACDTLESSKDIEPYFSKVLEFIESHPELNAEFKYFFTRMILLNDAIPVELVAFCMHKLRWTEIRTAAENRCDSATTPGLRAAMADVISAYSDDWSDADLYSFYSA